MFILNRGMRGKYMGACVISVTEGPIVPLKNVLLVRTRLEALALRLVVNALVEETVMSVVVSASAMQDFTEQPVIKSQRLVDCILKFITRAYLYTVHL